MAAANLLSLTYRKNTGFESEIKAISQTRVEAFAAKNAGSQSNIFSGDSVTLNGRILDIMGDLTDEQIESVMKTGLEKTVDKIIEVITTSSQISDKEILDICASNPAGAPARLRIIRKAPYVVPTEAPTEVPTEAPTEVPTEAPTEVPTEAPTEVPTEAPTEVPTDPPTEPPTEAPTEAPADITLTRKSATSYKSITLTGTETKIKLTNSVDGKDYYYTLSTTDGSSQSVDIAVLDNSNFVISGSYVKVTAKEGQDDNLIIMGARNEIYTNSGDDIIRVNYVKGSSVYTLDPSENMYNKVYAGAGDDYIISRSYLSSVDGGAGNDTITYAGSYVSTSEGGGGCTSNNVENKYSLWETNTNTYNNKVVGGMQKGYDDCKFLSFINALNYSGKLGSYVTISKSGSTYTVTFLKSGYSRTISESELGDNGIRGDFDFWLIETAFKKLLESEGYNIDTKNGNETHDNQRFAKSTHDWLLTKYIYGTEAIGPYGDIAGYVWVNAAPPGVTASENKTRFENDIKILLEAYKNGQISHFIAATSSASDISLGIGSNHAYAVVDGVANQYVVLINPWDSNDRIKLDWSDFLTYFDTLELYGDTYQYAYDHRDIFKSLVGTAPGDNAYYISSTDENQLTPDNFTDSEMSLYHDLITDNGVSDEIEDISCCIDSIKKALYEEKKLDFCW